MELHLLSYIAKKTLINASYLRTLFGCIKQVWRKHSRKHILERKMLRIMKHQFAEGPFEEVHHGTGFPFMMSLG